MRKRNSSARAAARGFTVMEALVAAAVLAIIAAIALPNFLKSRQGVNEGLVAPRLKTIAAAQASFRATLRKNRYAPLGELRTTKVDGVPLISPSLVSENGETLAFDGWVLTEVETATDTTFGIRADPADGSRQAGGVADGVGDAESVGKGGRLGGPGGIVRANCDATSYCVFEDGVVRKGTVCDCTRSSQPVDGQAAPAGKPIGIGGGPVAGK